MTLDRDALERQSAPAPAREPVEPPRLADTAFHGMLGEYVRTIAPVTEAHPAALLVSMMAGLGILIGRGPCWIIDDAPHHARLNVLLCGPTGSGRKSSALNRMRALLRACDDDFVRTRVLAGLSSGEGLIDAVRDPVPAVLDEVTGKVRVPADPGEPDKRLLVAEDEFGGVLKKIGREGNSLSSTMREGYDGKTLRTLTRNNRMIATDPHIGIIGCITPAELRSALQAVEIANGLANRFLIVWTEREHLLPHPPATPPRAHDLARAIGAAVVTARQIQTVRWTPAAAAQWSALYGPLSAPQAVGALASLLARGVTHTQRMALLFAVLDGMNVIDVPHLTAAMAVWDYCAQSARFVFSSSNTMTPRAEAFLKALHDAGPEGLDREALRRVEGSNDTPAAEIVKALHELREAGLARMTTQPTRGRPREVWTHAHHIGQQTREGTEGSEERGKALRLPSLTSLPSRSMAVPMVSVTMTTGDVEVMPNDSPDLTSPTMAHLIADVRPLDQDAA
ncbi:MAG: hypothetical protein ACK5ZR_00430 [Gemmatimonadaceae bacterium]